jgi:hypothetical protein
MSHFDELPRRDRNHEIEDMAVPAFQMRLNESRVFILQATDRKDYGTDCQIEVTAEGHATNTRVHVQLKGTESTLNADGSLSVEVRRTNLNYLLMQSCVDINSQEIGEHGRRLRKHGKTVPHRPAGRQVDINAHRLGH